MARDLNNDSILNAVYFDENETCMMRYNNYRNVKIGKAIYNETDGKLTVLWRFPKDRHDTSFWNISRPNKENIILTGKTGNETIQLSLIKTNLATVLFH